MPAIEANISIGDIEFSLSARRRSRPVAMAGKALAARGPAEGWPVDWRPAPARRWRPADGPAPAAADFAVRPAQRLAGAAASAAMVRDVAALGALILFATMLALVLSSADMLV